MGEGLDAFAADFERRTAIDYAHEYAVKEGKCYECHAAIGSLWGNADLFCNGSRIGFAKFIARQGGFAFGAYAKRRWEPGAATWSRLSCRCRSCGYEWQVFENAVATRDWACGAIRETNRTSEYLGQDVREISNGTASPSTRVVRFSREWTSNYALETTEGSRETVESSFAKLKLAVGHSLEQKYSVSFGEKRSIEEEISLTIPPQSTVTLTLLWKSIWQHGIIEAVGPDGTRQELPFKAGIELTFDERQTQTSP